jgi:sporulation protein YlmC with PRC-barrel domain
MLKHALTAAALAAVLAAPALAQTTNAPPVATPQSAAPASGATKPAGFLQNQADDEWRGSKLIGATVYGPDNKSIGDINDLIIDNQGRTKAAVIGVGGFLGIGEKNVAVPFEALQIQRKPNATSIEKITVTFTKQQLKDAPKFAYLAVKSNTTTGTGSAPPPSAAVPPKPAGQK